MRQIETGQCGFWIVCTRGSCRQCHNEMCLLPHGVPPLQSVLGCAFGGVAFAGLEVCTGIPIQPVVAAANPLQRQPARADPCTLLLVLVLVHIPSMAKMGHVPTCSRLGLVFGHQQPSHDRAVRLPAGLDTNLLQGPQPPFASCAKELV